MKQLLIFPLFFLFIALSLAQDFPYPAPYSSNLWAFKSGEQTIDSLDFFFSDNDLIKRNRYHVIFAPDTKHKIKVDSLIQTQPTHLIAKMDSLWVDSFAKIPNLKVISSLNYLPKGIEKLQNIERLYFGNFDWEYCTNKEKALFFRHLNPIPKGLWAMPSLKKLYLFYPHLSDSLKYLNNLEDLHFCTDTLSVERLPSKKAWNKLSNLKKMSWQSLEKPNINGLNAFIKNIPEISFSFPNDTSNLLAQVLALYSKKDALKKLSFDGADAPMIKFSDDASKDIKLDKRLIFPSLEELKIDNFELDTFVLDGNQFPNLKTLKLNTISNTYLHLVNPEKLRIENLNWSCHSTVTMVDHQYVYSFSVSMGETLAQMPYLKDLYLGRFPDVFETVSAMPNVLKLHFYSNSSQAPDNKIMASIKSVFPNAEIFINDKIQS